MSSEYSSVAPALTSMLAAAGAALASLTWTPLAHADATAYLINVTVRPGYHFANAEDALGYGYKLCDTVASGITYVSLIGDVKSDVQTTDDYQAAYLINQAVNELCPTRIPELRKSAAGYQPGEGAS